ncbi:unnamed protein product, partial [Onchocerca ochengi]|uniref:G protein-coupled receptor n=1 Tax=Onchocerca ochengi TaxID=42157 RepID=A0A182EMQ2_ONCOC
YDKIRWCIFLLVPVSFIYAISSASLFFGIYKYKEKFMKPALIARAILAVFSHATAFSIAVQFVRIAFNVEPTSELLLPITILLFLITIFALRTLRFIEQSIRYVEAYKRLLRKRTMSISYQIRSSKATVSTAPSPIISQGEQGGIVGCNSYQETGC